MENEAERWIPPSPNLSSQSGLSCLLKIWSRTRSEARCFPSGIPRRREEAYYLTIQAPEEITWELTKAGDPYDSGRASGTPLKLGVLQPGEHVVFQLTVKNAGDTFCSAFPAFSEKKILSCGTK